MWNVKTNVIPLIIGANGTIAKSFRKYPSKTAGKLDICKNSQTGHGRHTS
jgi:hypothetical protein